jgi:hypothetical protein
MTGSFDLCRCEPPAIDSLARVPTLRGRTVGDVTMGPLVTTEWLSAELGKPDLVVFDATKYLPNEAKDGHAEFVRAHIPGARYFDIDVIADPDTDLPHMVPTPGRFAKLIGWLGVANTSRIVFYDQKGLASAARGWWLMGLFGHDAAAVLDGGLAKEIDRLFEVIDDDPYVVHPFNRHVSNLLRVAEPDDGRLACRQHRRHRGPIRYRPYRKLESWIASNRHPFSNSLSKASN